MLTLVTPFAHYARLFTTIWLFRRDMRLLDLTAKAQAWSKGRDDIRCGQRPKAIPGYCLPPQDSIQPLFVIIFTGLTRPDGGVGTSSPLKRTCLESHS